MVLQWEGQTQASIHGAGYVVACEVGTPAVHIRVMESWMSAKALVSVALVGTRLPMMGFF